jgi:hypothetical protein
MRRSAHNLYMLMLEANQVIALRLAKLARGGSEAIAESQLMVSEKAEAALQAGAILASGGSVSRVVSRYRKHVASNAKRLSRPKRAKSLSR